MSNQLEPLTTETLEMLDSHAPYPYQDLEKEINLRVILPFNSRLQIRYEDPLNSGAMIAKIDWRAGIISPRELIIAKESIELFFESIDHEVGSRLRQNASPQTSSASRLINANRITNELELILSFRESIMAQIEAKMAEVRGSTES
jgi:hypothetical protein